MCSKVSGLEFLLNVLLTLLLQLNEIQPISLQKRLVLMKNMTKTKTCSYSLRLFLVQFMREEDFLCLFLCEKQKEVMKVRF